MTITNRLLEDAVEDVAEVVVVANGNCCCCLSCSNGIIIIIELCFRIFLSGRPRSVSKEVFIDAEEDLVDEEDEGEQEEEEGEDEMRIPGMPSKPCPQCDERFTTREGFLDHVIVHSGKIETLSKNLMTWSLLYHPIWSVTGAKCLLDECDWANPVPKDKTRLKQHMISTHAESIPTACTVAAR